MSEEAKQGDELLISLVRSYEHLWDKNNENYKDHQMKETSWSEIASAMDMTSHNCQSRWKRLRGYFSKERKKRGDEARSGSKGEVRKPWPLYKVINFLEETMHRRRTYSSFKEKDDLENKNSEEEKKSKKQKINEANKSRCIIKEEHSYKKTKGKCNESSEMLKAFSTVSSSIQKINEKILNKEESRDEALCKMILRELQESTGSKKKTLRKKLLKVIVENLESDSE
ncbi:transcription factor Adf-1-like [Chelonus insularis]|uniref:transcription factor Adf-1-like n=1 Tax=Chelonus insularis TaxID=460826 RepID=UPI00158EACAD|nr:transcription factor Adf-1-like [Chelonus insularis]XP_034945899.1 transcription factor Adf-1-like [Chelonus insularis]